MALEDPEGACHLVGFADQEYDTRLSLLLQRAFGHDTQDIAPGMHSFHVEWCGQQHSTHGGIARCVLGPGHVDLVFTPQASDALDDLQQLSISVDLDAAKMTRQRTAPGRIFANTGGLVIAP